MNEVDVIYNRYGEPVLRLLDNGRFVGFNGKSFGFLSGIHLYNYNGQHIGWFEGGIMRDLNGACVGFGEYPTDNPHPYLPYRQYKPYPAYVEYEPYRPYKQYPHYKPYKQYGWSDIEPGELFLNQ